VNIENFITALGILEGRNGVQLSIRRPYVSPGVGLVWGKDWTNQVFGFAAVGLVDVKAIPTILDLFEKLD
jgi:hypothetical protein